MDGKNYLVLKRTDEFSLSLVEDDDEVPYNNNRGTFADDDLDMNEGYEKNVDMDEAADAGFEIQDEDDVFGDLLSMDDGDEL